jgi:ribosomal protein L19E
MKTLSDSIAELKDYLNTLSENDTIPYNTYSELYDLVDGLNEHIEDEALIDLLTTKEND